MKSFMCPNSEHIEKPILHNHTYATYILHAFRRVSHQKVSVNKNPKKKFPENFSGKSSWKYNDKQF